MGLMDQIRADIKQITTNAADFGVSLIFEPPNPGSPPQATTITGIASKHHIGIGTDGQPVNTKNAHCSFSEQVLTAAGYTVRNTRSEVAMIGHKVSWRDSTGTLCKYVIRETFPDETVGLIVCILGDFK